MTNTPPPVLTTERRVSEPRSFRRYHVMQGFAVSGWYESADYLTEILRPGAIVHVLPENAAVQVWWLRESRAVRITPNLACLIRRRRRLAAQ